MDYWELDDHLRELLCAARSAIVSEGLSDKESIEMYRRTRERLDRMQEVLRAIVEDFDQEGCDADLGTVRASCINEARRLFDMKPLDDSSDEDK